MLLLSEGEDLPKFSLPAILEPLLPASLVDPNMVSCYARAIGPAQGERMTISFGSNITTIGMPTWDAPTDTITWAYATEGVLFDDSTGVISILWNIAVASTEALANSIWLELSDPVHPVAQDLDAGINVIECPFPVSADIVLQVPDGYTDPWYGNEGILKLGVVRRRNVLHYDQPIWLNALSNAISFGFPLGDAVEIILPPGVRGQAAIFPWVGLPPTYANLNGGTFVNSNLGWWWSPFVTS